jgi:hypothetical protein
MSSPDCQGISPLASSIAAAAALAAGCFAEPLEDYSVPVLAVLDGDSLRLQAGDAELDGYPEPLEGAELPHAERVLTYQLVDRTGQVVSTGVVPDTRHVRSEWEGEGEVMTGLREFEQSGALGVWLPQVAGEIRVWEDNKADGAPFAATPYEPRQQAPAGVDQLTRSLLSVSDLRRPPQKLWGSAPQREAINILFVPEGFRASELGTFREAARETLAQMFAEKPEFRRHDDRFNAWVIDIPSQDSGVSIPAEGLRRTTAFEIRVNDRNMLTLSARGGAAAAYLRTRWGMDVIVMLVNVDRHRGAAFGPLVTMPNSERRAHTFAHELGHALFGLADEYTEASACNFGYRLWNRTRPNVDNKADRRRIKWSHLIDSSTPLPTDGTGRDGEVGAFEGAGYCESGWYRPQHTCLMRTSREASMCAVCRAEMDRVMGRL